MEDYDFHFKLIELCKLRGVLLYIVTLKYNYAF